MTIAAGTKIGPYEIVAWLGAGGMGDVYRARDPRLAREVAIKLIPETFATDTNRLHRFEQEARAAGFPTETEAGVVVGTAGYMSPEQIRGEAVDARSDLFSFGSILYEMLTGRPAFARDTSVETMAAILKEDPPPLISPDVPPA